MVAVSAVYMYHPLFHVLESSGPEPFEAIGHVAGSATALNMDRVNTGCVTGLPEELVLKITVATTFALHAPRYNTGC